MLGHRGGLMDEQFYNRVGGERISGRQIDELIGIARGLTADGMLNQAEIELFKSVATLDIANQMGFSQVTNQDMPSRDP